MLPILSVLYLNFLQYWQEQMQAAECSLSSQQTNVAKMLTCRTLVLDLLA
jgi:hypothetical protein